MAKKKTASSRLAATAVVLAVIFVSAFAAVRFFQTESGRIFLLDLGLRTRFEPVQADLGKRITKALRRRGVMGDRMKVSRGEAGDPEVVVIRAEAPPDASLIQVNESITKAVRATGGRVRSCVEGKNGSIITMEIGTRRVLTHRCIVRKAAPPKPSRQEDLSRFPAVAILVDDFGYFDNDLVKQFLELDVPLSISVIPGLKYSERICRQALEAGREVLCHLPMEPEGSAEDSGEIPLIRVGMSAAEIDKATDKAVSATTGIVGVNNHMGSRATADRKTMEAVLKVCRRRGIFFLDSMTTAKSVAREAAREAGVPALSNDLFVDSGERETRENMKKLLSIAQRRGSAVGIMHVRPKTLEDLRWMVDEARSQGVEFLTISQMLRRMTTLAQAEGGRS